jgi:signal transduction histidine kinase
LSAVSLSPSARGESPCILLVDDEEPARVTLQAMLEDIAPVHAVGNGEEALDWLSENEAAVVLLDVHMPGLDGLQIAERMRAQSGRLDAPIIFLTSDPSSMRHGYARGAADFVVKPAPLDILRAKVRVFVELHHKSQLLARQGEELARKARDLEAVAFAASHELKEPIRMVQTYASLLEERYAATLDERGRRYIEHLSDGARRLGRTAAAIRSIARAQSEPIAPRAVRVQDALTEALEGVERRNQARIEVDGRLPMVLADHDALVIVLRNLIDNAIKFSLPRGAAVADGEACSDEEPSSEQPSADEPSAELVEVRISSRREDSRWILEIADQGVGIDTELVDKAFEPFRRLHARDAYDGEGIGLSMVRRLVELMGGRVWLESNTNHGTTVYVELSDSRQSSAPRR